MNKVLIHSFLLVLMLIAGFLIGKYVYYDTTWNSLTEELNAHMALNSIGLCKIDEMTPPHIIIGTNFSLFNFTLKADAEGQ